MTARAAGRWIREFSKELEKGTPGPKVKDTSHFTEGNKLIRRREETEGGRHIGRSAYPTGSRS